MGNVESVSKEFKIFLTKTERKNIFGKNYLNALLNWMVLHRLMQNISISKLTVKTGLKIYRLPSKNPKIEFFIANNSPKIFSDGESLEYDR